MTARRYARIEESNEMMMVMLTTLLEQVDESIEQDDVLDDGRQEHLELDVQVEASPMRSFESSHVGVNLVLT